MRRKLIAGNWKMHLGPKDGAALARAIVDGAGGSAPCDYALYPPYVTIAAVADVVRGTAITLGAQNLHWEPKGAFTGEVSGPLLHEAGCTSVIIGHSERRAMFSDSNDWVARKLRAAQEHGLEPIVCVGESLEEREAGKTQEVVSSQIIAAYGELTADAAARTVVAYEPVWAIGTGKVATPEQAVEVHASIRSWMKHRFGPELADGLRILYGGSVKPGNAAELLVHEDIDGALVGGASLDAASFLGIGEAAPVTQNG